MQAISSLLHLQSSYIVVCPLGALLLCRRNGTLLRRIGPRMLIVDEVRHLVAGGHREQRASLNLLKYLANDLKLSS